MSAPYAPGSQGYTASDSGSSPTVPPITGKSEKEAMEVEPDAKPQAQLPVTNPGKTRPLSRSQTKKKKAQSAAEAATVGGSGEIKRNVPEQPKENPEPAPQVPQVVPRASEQNPAPVQKDPQHVLEEFAKLRPGKLWWHTAPDGYGDGHVCATNDVAELFLGPQKPGCRCQPTDCTHAKNFPRMLYLSSHLYSAQALEGLLRSDLDRELFVGVFNFGSANRLSGHFDNVIYHYIDENRIHLRRNLAVCSYQLDLHSHDWMFSGYLPDTPLRSDYVCHDRFVTIFSLHLDLTNPCLRFRGRGWHAAVQDGGPVGSFTIPGKLTLPSSADDYDSNISFIDVELSGVSSWYGMLVVHTREKRKVVVSKAIIGTLSALCIGKPRSPTTFGMILARSRSLYSNIANLPEELKAEAILMSSAIAFTLLLDVEVGTVATMLRDYSESFRKHDHVWKWSVPYDLVRALKILSVVVSGSMLGYQLGIFQPWAPVTLLRGRLEQLNSYRKETGMPSSFPDRGVEPPPLQGAWHFEKNLHQPRVNKFTPVGSARLNPVAEYDRWPDEAIVLCTSPMQVPPISQLSYLDYIKLSTLIAGAGSAAASLITSWWTTGESIAPIDLIYLPAQVPLPFVNEVAEPKYPVSEEVALLRRKHPERTEFRPRLVVMGVLFNDYVPYSFPTGMDVIERSMLESRILIETPPVDVEFSRRVDEEFFNLPLIKELAQPVIVDQQAWLNHYSGRRKAELTLATQSLREEPLSKKDMVRSVFVKIDKAGYLRVDGPELSTPRQIISGTARLLAATGPFHWAVGNRMKEILNTEAPIFYGSTTAEQCGRAMQRHIDHFGGSFVVVEGDASRMDAHERADALMAEHELNCKFGMPPEIRWTDVENDFPAYTVGGIYFRLFYRRCTGDSKTSTCNTLNMAKVTFAGVNYLEDCIVCQRSRTLILGEDYFIDVNGDNFNIVAREGTLCELDVANMSQIAERLGYRVKYALRRKLSDVEFCSRLYWPTEDGLVLGAKIGRFLTKAGACLESNDPYGDYRSQMLGHLCDNSFVPLVSAYCTRMIQLTTYETDSRHADLEDYKIHAESVHNSNLDTLLFLMDRYGLTRSHIDDFQNKLNRLEQLPAIIQLPWLEQLVERDH